MDREVKLSCALRANNLGLQRTHSSLSESQQLVRLRWRREGIWPRAKSFQANASELAGKVGEVGFEFHASGDSKNFGPGLMP